MIWAERIGWDLKFQLELLREIGFGVRSTSRREEDGHEAEGTGGVMMHRSPRDSS